MTTISNEKKTAEILPYYGTASMEDIKPSYYWKDADGKIGGYFEEEIQAIEDFLKTYS